MASGLRDDGSVNNAQHILLLGHTHEGDGMIIEVKVIPNAKHCSIERMDSSSFKVRLKARPEKGKANRELIDLIEEKTGKKAEIIKGHTSQKKVVKIYAEAKEESKVLEFLSH